MPTPSDTRAFETAIQALLSPLAAYARGRGIDAERFAKMVSRAARGRVPRTEPTLSYDAAVRLISRWSSDRSYATRGRPRILARSGPKSFATLARSARAGAPERALRALSAAGVVRVDPRGKIRLLRTEYVPATSGSERLDVVGRAAAEFLRVLTHNLSSSPDGSLLQRVASYDNIGSSSVTMLRRALRREGLRALRRANDLLAARDRDRNPRAPAGRRTRLSFGVYLLEEPVSRRSGSR